MVTVIYRGRERGTEEGCHHLEIMVIKVFGKPGWRQQRRIEA
jgi:hypothetical protein